MFFNLRLDIISIIRDKSLKKYYITYINLNVTNYSC